MKQKTKVIEDPKVLINTKIRTSSRKLWHTYAATNSMTKEDALSEIIVKGTR